MMPFLGKFIAIPNNFYQIPENEFKNLFDYLQQFKPNILRNIEIKSEFPKNSFLYREPIFSYNKIKFHENLILYGYFQSKKYFNKRLIRILFEIDNSTKVILKENTEIYKKKELQV